MYLNGIARHADGLVTSEEEKWRNFLDFRARSVADYQPIGGGEFCGAEIQPMGFRGEFPDTGIKIPEPGQAWTPVQIEEEARIQA